MLSPQVHTPHARMPWPCVHMLHPSAHTPSSCTHTASLCTHSTLMHTCSLLCTHALPLAPMLHSSAHSPCPVHSPCQCRRALKFSLTSLSLPAMPTPCLHPNLHLANSYDACDSPGPSGRFLLHSSLLQHPGPRLDFTTPFVLQTASSCTLLCVHRTVLIVCAPLKVRVSMVSI